MINGDLCHEIAVKNTVPRLSYDKSADFDTWKAQIEKKLTELTGYDLVKSNVSDDLRVEVESREEFDTYSLIRFSFESEASERVPCYLTVPKLGKKKYPVAITLQGHSSGFHNSVRIKKSGSAEEAEYQIRGAFAIQASENGYVGLAIEQRGMGERKPTKDNRSKNAMCIFAGSVALHLGRTLIAERAFDISRAIDALASFDFADTDKVIVTGNSGGGTATYYAACFDERIKIAAPSCSFCPYPESILDIHHCICNYIPSAYRYFDMQDLACLIAPRKLVIIAGKHDLIFPIEGVKRGFATVKEIYSALSAEENCRLIETPKDHWWCEDLVWSAINEEAAKLGW